MRYKSWGKGVLVKLKLWVLRGVRNVFGQKLLDHPNSILFIFDFISWVLLGSTSWVMTLVRSSNHCTQVSINPLIKTKKSYSHKMIETF